VKDYHEVHPEVTVLDPPNAIEHLNNRQSMLEEVADLNLSSFYGSNADTLKMDICAMKIRKHI
jgi:hypothetical protein